MQEIRHSGAFTGHFTQNTRLRASRKLMSVNGATVSNGQPPRKRNAQDYQFGNRIGEGSYLTVYLAVDLHDSNTYAIKVLSKKHIVKEGKIKYVNIEKSTLRRLGQQHPGIVQLYFTFQDELSLFFVLDIAEYGELLSIISKFGSLSEAVLRFYAIQIIDAVRFIHSKGVIHRDLKPENILVGYDFNLKITDFGAAKLLGDTDDIAQDEKIDYESFSLLAHESTDRKGSFVGTAEYVPPELLKHNTCGFETDIWAVGCVLFQFFNGTPPFKGTTEYLTFEKIIALDYSYRNPVPGAVKEIIDNVLLTEPSARWKIPQIQALPWFKGVPWNDRDFIWSSKVPRFEPYVQSAGGNPVSAGSQISGNPLSAPVPPHQPKVPSKPINNRNFIKSNSNQQLHSQIQQYDYNLVPSIAGKKAYQPPTRIKKAVGMPAQMAQQSSQPQPSSTYSQQMLPAPTTYSPQSQPVSTHLQQTTGPMLQSGFGNERHMLQNRPTNLPPQKPPLMKGPSGNLPRPDIGEPPGVSPPSPRRQHPERRPNMHPMQYLPSHSTPQVPGGAGLAPAFSQAAPRPQVAKQYTMPIEKKMAETLISPVQPTSSPGRQTPGTPRDLRKNTAFSKMPSSAPPLSKPPQLKPVPKQPPTPPENYMTLKDILSFLEPEEKILKLDTILKLTLSNRLIERVPGGLDDEVIELLISKYRDILQHNMTPVVVCISNKARVFLIDSNLDVMMVDLTANKGGDYLMYDYEFEDVVDDSETGSLEPEEVFGYLILELIKEGGDLIFLKRFSDRDRTIYKNPIRVLAKDNSTYSIGAGHGWIESLIWAKEMVDKAGKEPAKKNSSPKNSPRIPAQKRAVTPKSVPSRPQSSRATPEPDLKKTVNKFAYAAAAAAHK